jgi:hypothetical protein
VKVDEYKARKIALSVGAGKRRFSKAELLMTVEYLFGKMNKMSNELVVSRHKLQMLGIVRQIVNSIHQPAVKRTNKFSVDEDDAPVHQYRMPKYRSTRFSRKIG